MISNPCPRNPAILCPVTPCLGESDPGVCDHLARRAAWGALSHEEQLRRMQSPEQAAQLARVRDCPDRGPVLPISMQPEGCSKCGEKSECRAEKGEIPGRVSLRECLSCVALDAPRQSG